MSRLGLHRLPGNHQQGYVVDVQPELLSCLTTRIVVPLLPVDAAPKPITDLNPIFDVDGKPYVLVTQALASIPITRTIDILLIGSDSQLRRNARTAIPCAAFRGFPFRHSRSESPGNPLPANRSGRPAPATGSYACR